MTRDEAIEKYMAVTKHGRLFTGNIVDGLTALGVLRLVEPKSATHKLCEELAATPLSGKLADITDAIDRAGLKLVDK